MKVKKTVLLWLGAYLLLTAIFMMEVYETSLTDGEKMTQARARRLQASIPTSYTVFRDGSTYYAEANILDGTNYEGADFSTVMQAAIDALPTYAGVIMLKCGTYEVTKAIKIKGWLTIQGEGVHPTYLKLANGANCNILEYAETDEVLFFALKDLQLYGNKGNNTSGRGLSVVLTGAGKFWDVRLERLFLDNFKEEGIYTESTWGWVLDHVVVEYCDGDGVTFHGSTRGQLYGCKFNQNKRGLHLSGGQARTQVLGCEMAGNDEEGILVAGARHAIIGCSVRDNSAAAADTDDGIMLGELSDYTRVIGCEIDGGTTQRYGVSILSGAVEVIVSGNNFLNGVSGAVSNAEDTALIRNNQGFVTENSGTVAVPKDAATTYKDWPHGLAVTPTQLQITPQETDDVRAVVPQANIGATNFRVVLSSAQAKATSDVTGAVADDGGVQTDETTAATNDAVNDMTLLPAAPEVDDAYYLAGDEMFCGIELVLGTQGAGTYTITWEYYNGAWVALAGVTDNSNGFKAAPGTHAITFTIPTDWKKTTVKTLNKYWVRARCSAYTPNGYTQPFGTRAYTHDALHYLWEAEA